MPVGPGDRQLRFSTLQGSAGNTYPGAPGRSDGKYVSTTPMTSGQLSNLFPKITGEENTSSNVDYQCVFLVNLHPSISMEGVAVYLATTDPDHALIALAADDIGASDIGSLAPQAAAISDKDTAPTGVGAFSTPLTEADAIALGDIGPGQVRPLWIRRTAANTPPTQREEHTLRFTYDSAN